MQGLDLTPGDWADPCPQGLGSRFLGSKADCQCFSTSTALQYFLVREYAFQETFPVAIQCSLDTPYFDDINSGFEDHVLILNTLSDSEVSRLRSPVIRVMV
jgi:hypothetical protein